MIQEQTLSSWENLFNKCVSDIKGIHPGFNDGQIAKLMGISRATFNRMKNEPRTPQLENMIKLIIGSNNIGLLGQAVNLIESGLGEKLRNAMEVSLNEKEVIAETKKLETLFENREVFVTYLLCSKNNGTSRDEVVTTLGSLGEDALKILIEKNIIFSFENKYFLRQKGNTVRSFDSIKFHLPTYARFYHQSHVGQEKNYVHSLSEGLNANGLKATSLAHKEFHKRIQEIYRDPQYQGDIPAFSVAFCDTFTSEENINEGEE